MKFVCTIKYELFIYILKLRKSKITIHKNRTRNMLQQRGPAKIEQQTEREAWQINSGR